MSILDSLKNVSPALKTGGGLASAALVMILYLSEIDGRMSANETTIQHLLDAQKDSHTSLREDILFHAQELADISDHVSALEGKIGTHDFSDELESEIHRVQIDIVDKQQHVLQRLAAMDAEREHLKFQMNKGGRYTDEHGRDQCSATRLLAFQHGINKEIELLLPEVCH